MVRRSVLVACAIATGASTVFAPNALANEFEVPFEGTINNICEFSVDSPGTLERSTGSGYELRGEEALVTANCSSPANVQVTGVNQVDGTTPFPSTYASLMSSTNSPGNQNISVAPGGESFGVSMSANSEGVPIENGNYVFNVLLTATPN